MKDRHSIVCATYLLLFNKKEEVLLLRRFNTGYEDGNYSVPAGHVDKGESVLQTLVREVKEEVGIEIDSNNIELVHIMHRNNTNHNDERLDFFFACREWIGTVDNCEPHKCDDLSWFNIGSLPPNTIPYIKKGINFFSQNSLYSEFGW